jgi:P27 family predicted phage terminase small subunit
MKLAVMLSEIGVLRITDLDLLASYCGTSEEVRELTEEVKKAPKVIEYGKGNREAHPNVVLSCGAQKHLLPRARELGLTPSARIRIEATPIETREDRPLL